MSTDNPINPPDSPRDIGTTPAQTLPPAQALPPSPAVSPFTPQSQVSGQNYAPGYQPQQPQNKKKSSPRGLAGIGAALLALFSKLKALLIGLKLLTFGKILLSLVSMLVSIAAYAHFYGWGFGVGIVMLIFIHECGHAFAARSRGIKVGILVFIPFMGAMVTTGRYGKSIAEDAYIGIMGPIVGTLASAACLIGFAVTGSNFWLALARTGFLINLFNLIPTAPLDGGWISPLFSPKLLADGAVLLLFVIPLNPMIGILALLSLPRIISGWRADPRTQPYYRVSSAIRWKFGLAYLGLAIFLALSAFEVVQYLSLHGMPFA